MEQYLQKCFQHPVISISSLLKDFLSVQREDDKLIEAITNTTTTAVSTRRNSSSIYGNQPTVPPVWSTTTSTGVNNGRIIISSSSSSNYDHTETPETMSHPSEIHSSHRHRKVTIDQFDLLKVIGKGCMGKVLLVKSNVEDKIPSSKLYALKVISKQKVIQQNEIQHTKAERDILTRLRDQPFLIKLHYAFQSDTHLYFVLDYICGGDIATQMSLCLTFTKERTQFYAAEILLGLSILHSHGIIYRDLKPENILIGRDGHIVLTDFGLSKVFTMLDKRDMGLPMTGTFCGTAEYLAPEVLLGEQYSYAVDYWSLGTLIYEMLSGMTPFWADTHMEMFRRVLEDNLEFPISDAFDETTCDFLSGLLERDPYDRLGWDSSEQIKKHGYFGNLDWDDVAQRKLIPPYIPTIESETDLTHFDESFVAMTPRISEIQQQQQQEQDMEDEDPFRYFAFDPRFSIGTFPEQQEDESQSLISPTQQQQKSLRPRPSHQRLKLWTGGGRERFSTSSSCLSFGTGDIIRHTDTMPSILTGAKNTPSLATSVRKRHSAALSFDCLDSPIHPTTPTTTTTTTTTT
ncbi:kinase-like domain-containing protein [Halteromyces radiatus]|uniref:kinase-like domain-containing protein n=1 Tax=Halteromyces radiatus TaxID=101107 RepID=UPI0022207C44|nr:kinase-like domain-containing protein [Halteromyces radiatus]KAI8084509.1 kinase-like domain-containing protein [Halteromyces radiatus]